MLTNAKMKGHELIDSLQELVMFRTTEVFAEAIPCTLIQVTALLESDGIFSDKILFGSLLCSAAVTAYSTAYLTYLKDIDPTQRFLFADFYGFVPTSSVGFNVVRSSMILMSFCQVIGKCFALAILHDVGLGIVTGYITIDIGLFFLLKIIRGDLRYWLPIDNNVVSWIVSILDRLIVKVVGDFTGMIHLREPREMGGTYWLLNQIMTMASIFVAIYFHNGKRELGEEEISIALGGGDLFLMASVLTLVWSISFALLLLFCDKRYRKTFYSTDTTSDLICEAFNSDDDSVKQVIFTVHRKLWGVKEESIKLWLEGSWDSWHAEKKEWFTDKFIASIPADLVPGGEEELEGGNEQKVTIETLRRRKSSMMRVLMEGRERRIRPSHDRKRADEREQERDEMVRERKNQVRESFGRGPTR